MKVVFLGSNPSNASPLDDAFTNCKSRKTLDQWVEKLGLTPEQVEFNNIRSIKTPKNRPLKSSEIKAEFPRLEIELHEKVVISLGKTAQKALFSMLCMSSRCKPIMVIELPHPSGLNRQLNDIDWLNQTLDIAREKVSQFIDFTP